MEKIPCSVCLTVIAVLLSSVICEVRSTPLQFQPRNTVDLKKDAAPAEFDWRTKGVISPVRNQGMIGDVMAFVLTEGVESWHAINTHSPLVLLSVQEAADCCTNSWGSLDQGFVCITRIGGLCAENAYHNHGSGCANSTCQAVGKVEATGWITGGREDIMMEIILQTPIIVAIDASRQSFQEYTSGVYSDPSCSTKMLDHALQVVGYGTDEAGQDYWILKNSWGLNWGEKGYIRMARGKNMCGIATLAFYPKDSK